MNRDSANLPVGALSVMVARFAADANSRPQTVILHPRPIGSANRPTLQMSSIRGSTVISGQTMAPTGSTPSLTSSSASISVRTTHLISGQQHPTSAVPMLNLQTVSHANTSAITSHSASAVKQLCGPNRPFISTSGPLPIESVSLVMANPSDPSVVNARPIRFNNDLKTNNIQHISKLGGPRTAVVGSTLMATQPTKMAISIGGSPAQTTTTVPTHVARVGIIGQLPLGSGPNNSSNKSGIINLAKGQFIINSTPTANINTTLHNMVNVSTGSVASFATTAQTSNTTKLTVNSSANNAITSRHSIVSTAPFIQHNVSTVAQHPAGPANRSTLPSNASINLSQTPSVTQQQQSLPTSSVTTSSTLRPTILSSPASSPVKQSQLQASTPSSPRPSILIRKRIANDSTTGLTPTALFKTAPNTSLTAPTIPVRVSNYSLKVSDSSGQLSAEKRLAANELTVSTDPTGANCAAPLPTTPNSEGSQTPRKKPRKQLLEPSSLKSSQNMHLLNNNTNTSKEKEALTEKESPVRNNKNKPRVSLLSSYSVGWKSLQYHFLKYSDVRPKPEKKLTLSELSNEGLQRKNGWKIHHLATQMEVMADNEDSVFQRLNQFLDTFERDVSVLSNQCSQSTAHQTNSNSNANTNSNSKTNSIAIEANNSFTNNDSVCELKNRTAVDSSLDSITVKLNDLIRGNLQRSHLFSDQISEARQLLIKLTNDHKERVEKITKKCANKRTYITK